MEIKKKLSCNTELLLISILLQALIQRGTTTKFIVFLSPFIEPPESFALQQFY